MTYTKIEWSDQPVTVMLGNFCRPGCVAEFYATIELNESLTNAEMQYCQLEEAVQYLLQVPELKASTLVWKRFFVSDATNQAVYLTSSGNEAVSVVQQPPLNRTKASVLLYLVEGAKTVKNPDGSVVMNQNHYEHLFHTQLHERISDVAKQTTGVFDRYCRDLSKKGYTLDNHCIRTWIFVQDVDVQYAGMVTARKDCFEREGLNCDTHYIASTGIEGRYIYPEVLMLMDAYAVGGLQPGQIRYLQALTHLNPTYEYGVTFERATAVDYGDRRHIFVSGTASINNKGEVVHSLDIEKQTGRTFENIRALLAEADAGMEDIAYMIVYLRDTADYAVVDRYIAENYADIPKVMVLAPVCRPGWLVEIECIAIKEIVSKYKAF